MIQRQVVFCADFIIRYEAVFCSCSCLLTWPVKHVSLTSCLGTCQCLLLTFILKMNGTGCVMTVFCCCKYLIPTKKKTLFSSAASLIFLYDKYWSMETKCFLPPLFKYCHYTFFQTQLLTSYIVFGLALMVFSLITSINVC